MQKGNCVDKDIRVSFVIIVCFGVIIYKLLENLWKFQEKIKKLREDWHYVKNRGEAVISHDASVQGAAAAVARETATSTAYSPRVHTGKRHAPALSVLPVHYSSVS